MKTCSLCSLPKEDKEFNKNKRKKDGLNTICRECSNKKSRAYYKNSPEKHKKNVHKRNVAHRKNLHTFILKLLEEKACKDCGNEDIRVLEFDHLPEHTKSFDISWAMRHGYSEKRILSEIDKCDIVCCNCHRIRTIERSKTNYRKSVHSSIGGATPS